MTPDEAALLEKYRAEDGADKQRVLGGASAYNVITVIHPIGPFVRIDGGKPDGLEVPAQFITGVAVIDHGRPPIFGVDYPQYYLTRPPNEPLRARDGCVNIAVAHGAAYQVRCSRHAVLFLARDIEAAWKGAAP